MNLCLYGRSVSRPCETGTRSTRADCSTISRWTVIVGVPNCLFTSRTKCTSEHPETTAEVRIKRQAEETTKKEESFEKELCKDKDAGEWFRLVAGEGDNCRDVIQCTSSGLQAIRCPAGLYFDIEKQTCDWKDAVKNCKFKNKERKVKPLLITDEPLCQDGFLACGDGNCIERGLFCNGEKDCSDGSDENSCAAS
uniref:Chitin-binding type-2 domain-containing protein n=1 Tax=Anopheles melas TaxID=34690 RepID=A0A182U5F5_9DIPT